MQSHLKNNVHTVLLKNHPKKNIKKCRNIMHLTTPIIYIKSLQEFKKISPHNNKSQRCRIMSN